MKSTKDNMKVTKIKFPCLMEPTWDADWIALVCSESDGKYTGFLVCGSGDYDLGLAFDDWTPTNMRLYTGKIILEN